VREHLNEVVKIEVVKMPKIYIVGKEIRYSYEALEKGDNRLPAFWDKCYKENIFAPLEMQINCVYDASHAGVFLDWHNSEKNFTYIVGILMKEDIIVPEGYIKRELPESEVALCWVKCKSIAKTRVVPFETTAEAIKKIGRSHSNMKWCIDLFHNIRSLMPDKNGDVLLDCYIPLD
jgi:predicted transcriptional regulator YdeE